MNRLRPNENPPLTERDLWLVAIGAALASRQRADLLTGAFAAEDAPDDALVRRLFGAMRRRDEAGQRLKRILALEGIESPESEPPIGGFWRLLLAKVSKRRFSEAIFRQRAEEESSLPQAIAAMKQELANLERLAGAQEAAKPNSKAPEPGRPKEGAKAP